MWPHQQLLYRKLKKNQMKKIILSVSIAALMQTSFAQTKFKNLSDSANTEVKADTLKVGNYYIVRNGKPVSDTTNQKRKNKNWDVNINWNWGNTRERKPKNIETNWWIFDLGFANVVNNTNYTNAQAGSYLQVVKPSAGPVTSQSMELKASKTSNVNIWVFMQKINLSKNKLNFKYGLGYEMFNLRYERSLSYRTNPQNRVFNDTINFSKNKLFTGYLTLPFMLNYTAKPNKYNSFSISGGMSFGYLLNSYNKQISNERGKVKEYGNLDLAPFKATVIGEIGLGVVRLYGSYSLTNMFKNSTRLEQYPFAVGVRFSNW